MSVCSGIKADGGRCKAQAIRNSQWCVNHHPDYEEARRRRASKGGKRGGRGRPLGDISRIQARLEELAEQVLEGGLDRADAAVAGQLLNYAVGAIRTGLKAKEVEELEERLSAMEEALERRKEGNRWRA